MHLILILSTFEICSLFRYGNHNVYQCVLPLPDNTVKRNAPCVQEPRASCRNTKGRREFYDHCIEAMFPCGEEGFTMSYAAKRFDMLHKELDHIGRELTTYLHLTEICFQAELEKVASHMSRNRVVNPESCLVFEKKAIAAMNKCFQEESRLCPLLSESEHANQSTLREHLQSVIDTFRVGGHYFNNTVVDLGIPQAVRECGHPEFAGSLISPQLPVKVTWCALFRVYSPDQPQLSGADLVERLSQKLNRSSDQFVFAGADEMEVCSQFYDRTYSIISWFASPDDPKLSEIFGAFTERTASLYVQFHEPNKELRAYSQCGDGIRQAGELCDFIGSAKGCDRSCNVNYGYKCSTNRLTASECVFQEVQHFEQPVMCPQRGLSLSSSSSRLQSISSSDDSNRGLDSQLAGSSSALSVRTVNLPFLLLIAVICLWLPRW